MQRPVLTAPQLAAYLQRIGYAGGAVRPTAEVLFELHRAHAYSVPYELLDWFLPTDVGGLWKPADGDVEPEPQAHRRLPSLFEQLVEQRRGGGCVHHNVLFASALRAIGFAPVVCWASISQLGSTMAHHTPGAPLPTEGHMVVCATTPADGVRYLCDLASPVDGLTQPVKADVRGGVPQPSDNDAVVYMLCEFPEDASYTELRLQRHGSGKWVRCLAFREIERDADYVAQAADFLNNGDNFLRKSIVVAQQRPGDGVDTLVNLRLRQRRGAHTHNRQITSLDEYDHVLRTIFGISVPVHRIALVQQLLQADAQRSKL